VKQFNQLKSVHRQGGNLSFATVGSLDGIVMAFPLTDEQIAILRSTFSAEHASRSFRLSSNNFATYLVDGTSAAVLNPPEFAGKGIICMAKATDERWYASIGGQTDWVKVDRSKVAKLRKQGSGDWLGSYTAFTTPNSLESLLVDVVIETEVDRPVGCGLIDKDGFVDSGVYVGLLWGVQFVDEQDEQVGDILWIGLDDEGEKAVASFFADKSNTKHWPVGATDIHDITKDGYRHPIYGIDYGAGSVKRRFSGIKVPRSTYQF